MSDELASVIAWLRKFEAEQTKDNKEQDGARFALRTAIAGLLQGQHLGECSVDAHGLTQALADEVKRVADERDEARAYAKYAEKLLDRAFEVSHDKAWLDDVSRFLGDF